MIQIDFLGAHDAKKLKERRSAPRCPDCSTTLTTKAVHLGACLVCGGVVAWWDAAAPGIKPPVRQPWIGITSANLST